MLQPWISHCTIGDRTVVLDAKRNRYLALRTATFRHLSDGELDAVAPSVLKNAASMGWLRPGNRSPVVSPSRDYAEPVIYPVRQLATSGVPTTSSVSLRFNVLVALATARAAIAMLPLQKSFDGIARRNATAVRRIQSLSTRQVVAGFDWAERYILSPNACLLRSIAMQAVLANAGLRSRLVIGVKLYPFEAHCWLQQNDLLINDTLERVGLFTPLKVVT